MARPRRDITGQTFGRLVVTKDNDGGKNPYVKCKCSCGRLFTALKHNVTRGNTKSCGCLRSEASAERARNFRRAKKDFGLPKQTRNRKETVQEADLDDEFWEDW